MIVEQLDGSVPQRRGARPVAAATAIPLDAVGTEVSRETNIYARLVSAVLPSIALASLTNVTDEGIARCVYDR